MLATVPLEPFRTALSILTPLVNPRSPSTPHRCVLVRARAGGTVELVVNNNDVHATRTIEGATVEEAGEFLTPIHLARSVFYRLTDREFRLELAPPRTKDSVNAGPAEVVEEQADGKTTIRRVATAPLDPPDHEVVFAVGLCDEYSAVGYQTGMFPAFDAPEPASRATLPAEGLARLVRQTVYAAERKKVAGRYALNGIHFNRSGPGLLAVATDGRRMALAEAEAEGPAEGWPRPHQGVVPLNAVAVLLGLVEQVAATDAVRVGWSFRREEPAAFVVDCAGFTFRARTLEGRFPPWGSVLPKSSPIHSWEYPHSDRFRDAVRKVAIVADGETGAIELEFDGGQLLVWAETEVGAAYARIGVPVPVTGPMHLAFRAEYLRDALGPVPTGSPVLFEFYPGEQEGTNGPALLSAVGYRAVVMPYQPSKDSRLARYAAADPAPVAPRPKPKKADPEPADSPAESPKPVPRRRTRKPLTPEGPQRPFAPEAPGRETVVL